jgi:hypothetical protein
MRRELHDVIDRVVQTRFAIEYLAIHVIHELKAGRTPTYCGHKWEAAHFEAMEQAHQGIEAAWHYVKWLQTPEMKSRLIDGSEALIKAMAENRLTDSELSIASPNAIEKGEMMVKADRNGRPTMAWLTQELEEMNKVVNDVNSKFIDQIAELERRVDELESGANDRRKARTMTDEQRKAAGERLQMGRAKKLGLDSIEQLRALHLRPGQKPTKAQVTKVKKEFPAT